MVDSEDRHSTEMASSFQSSILYDCDAEALSKWISPGQSVPLMIKWRCCRELVQFHGFRSVEVLKLDTPNNSPEAREGSTRVEFSPDQYQGRLFPSGDHSIPVKSSCPFGFGQVFSDQPAAYRHRTLWVMINWLLTCFHADSHYFEVGSWQEVGFNWVTVWLVNSWG